MRHQTHFLDLAGHIEPLCKKEHMDLTSNPRAWSSWNNQGTLLFFFHLNWFKLLAYLIFIQSLFNAEDSSGHKTLNVKPSFLMTNVLMTSETWPLCKFGVFRIAFVYSWIWTQHSYLHNFSINFHYIYIYIYIFFFFFPNRQTRGLA